MNTIDFTHTIEEGMPVYPGTEGPKLIPANSYEKNGFRETSLTFYSHTGTHMDAPAHLFPAGKTLDQFPAAHFVRKGLVIDCSELNAGESITITHIDRQEEAADKADYLLFYTGWSRYWGQQHTSGIIPVLTMKWQTICWTPKRKESDWIPLA